MEQQIRFCTSTDGTRIAYATVGQGLPLVRVLCWFTHLEAEWTNPLWRGFIDGLSRRLLFVRYDGRGMGLSDRNVKDFSLEAHVHDLEAVVDAAGLERVALFGFSCGAAPAIAYWVRHPERVSHLIIYGSFPRFSWLDTEKGSQQFEATLTLVRQGWDSDVPAYRQFFTTLLMPEPDTDAIRAFNELQRVSASGENVAAFLAAFRDIDVRPLLPRVTVPTLVIHRRGDTLCPFEGGRELATGIPGARFLPLDGCNHFPLPNEPVRQTICEAIVEFLDVDEEAAAGAEPLAKEDVHTILFTDMEGSTTLTQRLGDAKAQEVLRTHNSIVRDALKAHGGSEIKHTGDGIMASFASASRALECAIDIQRALAQHNEANPETPIRVRIGLNAGEPVAEEEDLFGTAVQLAARVAAKAEGEEILVSDTLRGLVAGKGFLFSDRGDVALRGFEDPVRLFEVTWREE
ncbi:MAG: alpha/beta fold hydrolase [Dehalococcoidia bacterium]|nr:MAG: alpha/beta fold hydrolase [Dehalococcoidia bacterium]